MTEPEPVVQRCGEGHADGFGSITYRRHVVPICTCDSRDEWIAEQVERVKREVEQPAAARSDAARADPRSMRRVRPVMRDGGAGHMIAPICVTCGHEIDKGADGRWSHVSGASLQPWPGLDAESNEALQHLVNEHDRTTTTPSRWRR